MVCHLALKLVKKTQVLHKRERCSPYNLHIETQHNNINKHSDKHTNKTKHTSNNHNNKVLNKLITKVQHVKRLSGIGLMVS